MSFKKSAKITLVSLALGAVPGVGVYEALDVDVNQPIVAEHTGRTALQAPQGFEKNSSDSGALVGGLVIGLIATAGMGLQLTEKLDVA